MRWAMRWCVLATGFALLGRREPPAERELGLVEVAMTQPFDEVKGMISGMIARLQASSAKDTTRKAWCEAELPKAAEDLERRKEDLDENAAKMDKFKAQLAKLALETADAGAAQNEKERREGADRERTQVELKHDQVMAEGDGRTAAEALDAAKSYLSQVEHSCRAGTDSSAVRKERREEEIANLRDAHEMLTTGLR
jgi:hypothetical protein